MGNEIYDEMDKLPAPLRVDIPAVDLALLERAARAIGALRFEEVDGEGYANLHFADGLVINAWNPLMHNDDTLDLAVRLKLSIDIRADAVCVIAGNSNYTVIEKGIGAGLMPATRRAITRAAAELAKSQPTSAKPESSNRDESPVPHADAADRSPNPGVRRN